MRDINRIDKILQKYAECWKEFPDMRFFQFLSFFVSETLPKEYQGLDLFFLEDDVMLEMVNKIDKVQSNKN